MIFKRGKNMRGGGAPSLLPPPLSKQDIYGRLNVSVWREVRGEVIIR
jgi:hypothetical protein